MKNRTEKAILNIGSNYIIQIIKTIFTFLTRTIFIKILGKEALGLNGLFINILSMLSLAELGIGTAINFSLYEPLAKNDYSKVSSLMSFYKKTYNIIGIIVFILGIVLVPFLPFFIKNINDIENVYLIYLLYLLNTVFSYFISYKETLVNADQKSYKLSTINLIFLVILNIFQITSLIIWKNFIVYLFIQFAIQLIQKVFINIYISKLYFNIDFNSSKNIDEKDFKVIKKNVFAMFFHKIGDYCVNSTDNLIISSFINVVYVGLYSNYLTVLSLITTFTSIFFNNLTSSFGNLNITESPKKKFDIFKKMELISFIMYGLSFVVLLNVFNDFITLWVGSDYCLDFLIVLFILISFYISGMRVSPSTVKNSAGLYSVDKFTPIIQALVNLVVSICLVKKIGILGVVIGTIISSLVLPSWQKPFIIYRDIFKMKFSIYLINFIKNVFIVCIVSIITLFINHFINFQNILLLIIFKCAIVLFVFCIFVYLFYSRTNEFLFFKDKIFELVRRKK